MTTVKKVLGAARLPGEEGVGLGGRVRKTPLQETPL